MTNLPNLAHAAAKPFAGLRIGCPDIDAQQAEAFRRINAKPLPFIAIPRLK